MIRTTAALLLLLGFASAAAAHPLPNTRYDRIVAVRLGPETITVRYTLEVTLFTISLDAAKLLTPEEIAGLGRSTRDLEAAYARKIAPEIARDLRATVDGRPLSFRVAKIDTESGEHPKFVFVLTADWPPGGKTRKFEFIDDSFDGRPGILNLTLDRADLRSGVSLEDPIEPDPVWRTKPAIDLTPEEAAGLRKASAIVTLPHDIGAPKPTQAAEPTVTVTESGERPSLAADLWHRGLPALFDSNAGIGALLLAALLFGAAHAFTPGHGKTLVAAYLVGERGTVWHAVILAIATTVAHTGSVLVVAVVLWSAYGNDVPGATQGVLNFLGGLLVAAVGAWLLMRRLTGRADHFHLFAGHHHHHHPGDREQETGDRSQEPGVRDQGSGVRSAPHQPHPPSPSHHHDHDHSHGHHHHHGDGHHHHHGPPPESAKTTAGWVRLLLMGLGGGLIPCWDAVLLLLAATAMNRVGFAIPLLVAFSAGLGAVLVLLGVSVVYAHRAGATRFQESRLFRMLPTVSAALLLALGLWLCQEGLKAAVR